MEILLIPNREVRQMNTKEQVKQLELSQNSKVFITLELYSSFNHRLQSVYRSEALS